MTLPTTPHWRALRSATFALVTAYLAALGHVVGGGGLPDLAPLLLAGVLIGGMVSGLAHDRRSTGQIFGLMAASQVAFHLLFEVTAHAGRDHLDLIRMAVFHLLAAVCATAVLASGEDTLFRLFAALTRVVLRNLPPAPVAVTPTWIVVDAADEQASATASCPAPVSRRGPPPAD